MRPTSAGHPSQGHLCAALPPAGPQLWVGRSSAAPDARRAPSGRTLALNSGICGLRHRRAPCGSPQPSVSDWRDSFRNSPEYVVRHTRGVCSTLACYSRPAQCYLLYLHDAAQSMHVRHTWVIWRTNVRHFRRILPAWDDTLGACTFSCARHSWGIGARRYDTFGGFGLGWCDTLGGFALRFRDTLGGLRPGSATYLGAKRYKTPCGTRRAFPLDVDSSCSTDQKITPKKKIINQASSPRVRLPAPETPWPSNASRPK